MFNLEQTIAEWRRQMLAAGIKTPVPLEELESHLRDEIEQQMKSGLSDSASFAVAVQKIGQAPALQNEFKKVETVRQARVHQVLCFAVMGVVSLIGCCFILPKIGDTSERMSGLAAMLTMIVLSWGGWFSYRFFPVIPVRIRDAFGVVGPLLGMLWMCTLFYIVLPRYDFTTDQLLVAILWGMMVTMGVLAGLMAGLEKCRAEKNCADLISSFEAIHGIASIGYKNFPTTFPTFGRQTATRNFHMLKAWKR